MLPDGLPDESSGSLPARIHDAAAIAALGSPDILPDILPDVLPDGLPVPAGGPATGASKGKRVQSGKLPKSRSGERAGATGGDRTAESGSAGSSTPPTAARKGTGEAAAEPSGGRYPVPGGAGLPAETADRTVPGKRRRRVRADLDLSFVRRDLLTVFGEWLAYKQARGNGYRTQASLEACYERLMTLSDGDPATAREVVRQSVANNWSGIFELRKHHACHTHTAYPGAVPGTAVPTHTDGYTDTL